MIHKWGVYCIGYLICGIFYVWSVVYLVFDLWYIWYFTCGIFGIWFATYLIFDLRRIWYLICAVKSFWQILQGLLSSWPPTPELNLYWYLFSMCISFVFQCVFVFICAFVFANILEAKTFSGARQTPRFLAVVNIPGNWFISPKSNIWCRRIHKIFYSRKCCIDILPDDSKRFQLFSPDKIDYSREYCQMIVNISRTCTSDVIAVFVFVCFIIFLLFCYCSFVLLLF